MDYGKNLLGILITYAVLLVSVGFVFGKLISGLLTSDEIRSDRPLTPRLELKVVDNKVDTVYVYSNE